MPADLESLLARLNKVSKTTGGFVACCPAHEDNTPSLAVAQSATGNILLKCHAGCSTDAICNALNLKLADLFADSGADNGHHPARDKLPPITAAYIYRDEFGTPLFRVTRHTLGAGRKTFRQWRPDPGAPDHWAPGIKVPGTQQPAVRLTLYRLPEINEAIALGHPIYVVEGEKDAEALVRAGLDATTHAGGAGKWRREYTDTLAGAHVVVIADKDDPGRKHALEVCAKLTGTAASVKYLELPGAKVKDAADYLAAGGTAAKIAALAAATAVFDPDNPPEPLAEDDLPDPDNAAFVCPRPPPLPDLILDGLLHRGLKMIVGGPSKAHKTWAFLHAAIAVALGRPWLKFATVQTRVLYLNFEVPREFIIKRICDICRALDAPYPELLDVMTLRGCDTRANTLLPKILARCHAQPYGLLVVDPLYKLAGDDYDENSAAAVNSMLRHLDHLATDLKAAIISGAHFAKGYASSKQVLDRISGSGVFARDADVFVALTPLKAGDDCFAFETRIRNLHPIAKFGVRWKYPLLSIDEALNPDDLKTEKTEKSDAAKTRRRPTLDFWKKVLPTWGTYDVTRPRHGVLSGAQLREAFEKAGYHVSTLVDAVSLAVDAELLAVCQSTLQNHQKYYGHPKAVELWRPTLADLDDDERKARKTAKRGA